MLGFTHEATDVATPVAIDVGHAWIADCLIGALRRACELFCMLYSVCGYLHTPSQLTWLIAPLALLETLDCDGLCTIFILGFISSTPSRRYDVTEKQPRIRKFISYARQPRAGNLITEGRVCG